MAAEPSLSEITNITVDPERSSSGEAPVIYDQRELVRNLNQAAQFKAENDWRKYQYFVNNLKDVYKNVDEIQAQDVMTEDRDYLQGQAKGIFADILKDPQNIYSPQLQQKLGRLRSDATESKQNRLFDYAHREFINRTPELNTDSNKQKIEEFRKLPLGQRAAYSLDMPTLFDYDTYKKSLLENPAVKTSFATSSVTPDNQFIREVAGNKYDRNKFMAAWNTGLLTQQDKYGHSIKGAAQQMFNQLSDNDKKYWEQNGGLEGFWNYAGQKAFGGDRDIVETVKDNLQANPQYMKAEILAEDKRSAKAREALGWANLQWDKDKWKEQTKGSETVKNSATIFAQRIVDELKKLGTPAAGGGYMIEPLKLRQLTVEQKKYLGIESPDEEGKVALRPLDVNDKNLIWLKPDGTIMVMKDIQEANKGKGDYGGIWDNTKSTTISNIATNRLNEQLKSAGAKELNAYTPIDIGQTGTQSDSYGGGSTKSGGSSTNRAVRARAKMPDGSIITTPDGKTWYNEKGEIVQ